MGINHYAGCRADYPEKPAGEAPQATIDTPLDDGSGQIARQCVDCGAFELIGEDQRPEGDDGQD